MNRIFRRRDFIYVSVPKRSFGITDTIMKMATNKIDDSKEKQFGKLIDMMVQTPKWTLRPWKQTMDSQLSSWTMYIPGVGSSDEIKNIKKFKKILDSMTDSELDSPESINGAAKERIAKQSEHTVEDITRMLFFYKQSLVLHSWLKMKKEAGEVLPSTEMEISEMQEEDSRLQQIIRKTVGQKRSGRGKRLPF